MRQNTPPDRALLTRSAAAASITVALLLVALKAWASWRTGSTAMLGSLADSTLDLLASGITLFNLAVIAALVLDTVLGLSGADPVFGLLIAAWLVRSAWRAGSEAIEHLMDAEWPEDKRRRLIEVVAGHQGFSRLHDLRTRTAGDIDIAQFHIEMDPDLTVREAHDMLERVEHDLETAFPGLELFVHIDPRGQIDDPGNTLVEANEFEKLEKRP